MMALQEERGSTSYSDLQKEATRKDLSQVMDSQAPVLMWSRLPGQVSFGFGEENIKNLCCLLTASSSSHFIKRRFLSAEGLSDTQQAFAVVPRRPDGLLHAALLSRRHHVGCCLCRPRRFPRRR